MVTPLPKGTQWVWSQLEFELWSVPLRLDDYEHGTLEVAQVQNSALPPTRCVSLGKVLDLSASSRKWCS